jgi:hypothetical protein
MKIVAKTRDHEVIDRINVALDATNYADPNSFEMRWIKRECERVREVEPALGWSLLACYNSMLGDGDEVRRCFQASWRLEKSSCAVANYYANLSNLGYFSEAHQFFTDYGRPEGGMLSQLAEKTTGSFQRLVSYFDEAEAKGFVTVDATQVDYRTAARILSQHGISDVEIALHMDAAGAVLRRHRMFYYGDIQIQVSDVEGVFTGITCVFRMRLSPDEVFDLNVELSKNERELQVQKSPIFDVMFLPA